ncbi:MAG: MerR family transcriptional regulator [Faecalibacterium sp.]
MKTSSEVATLVGIKRQRIQEYEKAGIALKPRVKEHGYWQYGEREIERLWQIKFYQELGFRVPDIKAIFSNPNYNKHDEIENLIAGLEQKKKSLNQ